VKRLLIALVLVLGLAGGLNVGLGWDAAEAQKEWTTWGGSECDGAPSNCAPEICAGNGCD